MMVCQSIMEEIAKKSTKVLQNEVVPSFHLAPLDISFIHFLVVGDSAMTGSLQLPGRHQINPQDILQNHSTAEYVAVFVTYFKELDQSPQNPKLPHSPENVTQPLAETPKSKLKVYINLHNQKPLKENHEMFTWEDGGDRFPVTDEDYACLNKDQLLNDSIIEYFKEMDQYAKKPLGSTRTSTNHRN